MAKAKSKVEVEEVEDDEVEELEEDELDLDDLADDDEEESDEEDDEDEDEEPVKKTKKSSTKKAPAKKKAAEKTTIGAADLAEALSTEEKTVSGRELRVLLRQKGLDETAKNENNRYEWASVEAALEQLGFDDLDEAREALLESRTARLEELKKKVAKTKGKDGKKSKKAAAPAEDEDDDDEEEEEVEVVVKKKAKK